MSLTLEGLNLRCLLDTQVEIPSKLFDTWVWRPERVGLWENRRVISLWIVFKVTRM